MRVVNIMISKVLGGVEQVFLDYNEALSMAGHEVFAFYNKAGKIKTKLKKLKNVIYKPSLFIKPTFFLLPQYLFLILKIRPDVIIVHSKAVLRLFTIIGKILKIPVVVVCHNDKTKTIQIADYIFSITEYQKRVFVDKDINDKKIFVIPNSIAFNRKFKEFNGFSKPPVFGVMGRFDPAKGFPIFIKACNILKEKGIDFQAKIAGSPQIQYIHEYKKIKRLVRGCCLCDNIEFTGWVDDKDWFYNNIDVFVCSSINESFGVAILEAMSYSKPIISSMANGPKEIFENSNAALMCETNNAEDLANKMIELANNQELAKKLAKNGYDLVKGKYDINMISKELNDTIKMVVEDYGNKHKKSKR